MKKMKKYIWLIMLLLVVATGAEAKKHKQLVILHTNDTHSCILPLKELLADTAIAGRGGFIRRIAMIKEQRKEYPKNLLLFDSGDFSQGSSYYTMFKGDVEVGLMNRMGYDAVTIGNHEFDFGLENMARVFKMAKFPIVCANYDFTGTVCEGLVKPYVVLKRNGVRVGVFGLGAKLQGLVSGKNCVGVKYLNPAEVTRKMVDILRNQEKCDVVICLSHLGWDISDYSDEELIPDTRGIDIVLGGHSHTFMKEVQYLKNLDGKQVADDQNGKHAALVGKLVVDLYSK
jgi:5'-nucleotidase